MAYVPNPADASQPVESVLAETAAAEFRALKAYVQSIVSGGGLGVATPGQICMFPGSTPLPGWLELDGSLVNRGTFASLWAAAQALGSVVTEATWAGGASGSFSSGDLAITFRLPDYRGVFPRGWNHGRVGVSVDPGRTIGTFQVPSYIADQGGSGGAIVVPQTANSISSPDDVNSFVTNVQQIGGGSPSGVSVRAVSMRPTNVSAMFCIKT